MFRVYFNPYQISVLQQFWNFKLICTVTISTESALLISNFLFLNIWITLQANNTYYRISSSYVRSNFNTVLYPLLNTNLNFRIFLIFEFPNKRLFRSFLFVLLYTLCPFNTVNLYYYTHIIIMVQLLLVQFHILSQIIIGLIHFFLVLLLMFQLCGPINSLGPYFIFRSCYHTPYFSFYISPFHMTFLTVLIHFYPPLYP